MAMPLLVQGGLLNIPDALIPITPDRPRFPQSRYAQSSAAKPVERRANVLAATRCRLAELGPEKVTLRMLAADCEVSVQTIFNLIGNRSQVLSEAINDYGRAIQETVLKSPNFGYKLITFVDAMWQSAARNQTYMRQACLGYKNLDGATHEAIRRAGIRSVRMFLLEENERFRKNVDVTFLSEAIHSMVAATMFDWACGNLDILKLREHLSFRCAALMLGAYKSKELDEMMSLSSYFETPSTKN